MNIGVVQIFEILVIVTTLLYNYFLIKQRIYCWLFGFLSSVFGLLIFWDKQLIGQIILHIFYALMAIYGFYFWEKNKQTLKVKNIPLINHLYIISVVLGTTFLLGNYVLDKFFGTINYFDIGITLFCFVATFKEAHKILSAWIYWMVLNIASMFLYLQSNLYLYALLMFVYTILSVRGFYHWKQDSE
jgi:nicotinamide mononucleotide transporter